MKEPVEQNAARKPRTDAQRNRIRLLEEAKTAFAEKGSGASLDEIARAAGLGIGTLYRHFPTRYALVEAVYRNEVQHLVDAARLLAGEHPPVEAMRLWMRVFVDHLATKQLMAETLNSMSGDASQLYASSGAQVKDAITMLADAAVANGDIRLDLEPLDLLRALVGVGNFSAGPNWEENAKQLVDVLIAGIKAPRAGA